MFFPLVSALVAGALVPEVCSSIILERDAFQNSKRTIVDRKELSARGFPVPDPTESYWQVPEHRIASLRTTEELPTNKTFDYVIIGSGISGAATAMKLLNRNPELSILMLEARTASSGASGRNGGHVKPGDWKIIKEWVETYGEDEALRIQKLEQDCVDDMADFVKTYNVSSGFHEVETADLYWTREAFEKAVKVWEYQQELDQRRPADVGKNNRAVYAGQAARDYWKWPEILGAITYKSAIQNPYLTVCAMLEQGLKKGLNLQTNTMALSLSQSTASGGAKWEVDTERGVVRGKRVVLATNSYTGALHPRLGKTKFLAPTRSQASAIHPEAYSPNNTVFSRSHSYPDLHSGNNYIMVRAPGDQVEGDVVIGGGTMFSPSREKNITDDSVINEDIALHLHRVSRTVFGYKNWGETTKVLGDWTGITCNTEDGFPGVGAIPDEEGLFASICMNGHGMAWAFRSAEALVELMEEGEAPTWFPKAFDVKRAFTQEK